MTYEVSRSTFTNPMPPLPTFSGRRVYVYGTGCLLWEMRKVFLLLVLFGKFRRSFTKTQVLTAFRLHISNASLGDRA